MTWICWNGLSNSLSSANGPVLLLTVRFKTLIWASFGHVPILSQKVSSSTYDSMDKRITRFLPSCLSSCYWCFEVQWLWGDSFSFIWDIVTWFLNFNTQIHNLHRNQTYMTLMSDKIYLQSSSQEQHNINSSSSYDSKWIQMLLATKAINLGTKTYNFSRLRVGWHDNN